MSLFKRKKKGSGDDSGSDKSFSNLETGQEEADDLLSRLQNGVESSREGQEQLRQAEKEKERVQKIAEARNTRRGCGCW